MSFSLIFDGALAALLMATITYAVILNRKLTELRNSRTEMESLIREFAEATQQAEQGVTALHERAEQASGTLDERVSDAEARVEDGALTQTLRKSPCRGSAQAGRRPGLHDRSRRASGRSARTRCQCVDQEDRYPKPGASDGAERERCRIA